MNNASETSPLVSVVIPVYNKADVVARALRSVCAQTFADLEILVVDDGSTDASLAAIAAISDPRIRVLTQPNRGESAARNRGIQSARGRFVAFLDADDEWLPLHLRESLRVLQSHPQLHWCCCAYERRSVAGKRLPSPALASTLPDGDFFDDYLLAGASAGLFCTNGMVVRRDVFDRVGLFDPSLRCGADQDMWFRIGLNFPRIGFSRAVTSIYRLHGTSVSQRLSGRPLNILCMLVDHRRLAAGHSPCALGRMELWTAAWVRDAVKAAIRYGDPQALEQIGQTYPRFLTSPWKQLRQLALAAPRTLMPLAGWGMNAVRRWRTSAA